MVNFLYPLWLWGMLLTPLVVWWQWRLKQQPSLIAPHLQKSSQRAQTQRASWLLPVGYVLTLLALSGPYWRQADMPVTQSGNARVIVMDMSLAMMGQDIRPNRYTQSVFKVMDLLGQLEDGYTGLVSYAADGYTVSPLTHDVETIRNHLPNLSPAIMPIQGKNAAKGVEQAASLLTQAGYPKGDIVLVTSGISATEQQAIEALAQQSQWRLSVLAIATTAGTPIYDLNGQLLTDNQGNTVLSRLHPARLRALTAQTGGRFASYRNDNNDIDQLGQFLLGQQDTRAASDNDANHDPLRQTANQVINDGYWLVWLVGFAALFAFRKGVIWSVALIPLLLPEPSYAAFWDNANRQAHQAYNEGRIDEAAATFTDPSWLGASRYQQGDYQGAIDAFSQITDGSADYNLANALAQNHELHEAAELYRRVIEADPNHDDAKHNLEVVEALLEQQKQQDQQQDQQNGDNSQQSDQQNDDQQSSEQQSGDEQHGQQSQEQPSQQSDGNDGQSQQDNPSESGQSQDSSSQGEQSSGETSQSEQSQSDDASPQQGQQGDGEVTDDARLPDQATQQQGERADGSEETSETSTPETAQPTADAPNDASEQQLETRAQQSASNDQRDDADSTAGQMPTQLQSGQVTEGDPILNKLDQIPDDRSQLLRNQLILQAREREQPRVSHTEW